jgi:hypothetical protein
VCPEVENKESSITAAGVEKLKKALPKCKIEIPVR